jgi:hypothetical protein
MTQESLDMKKASELILLHNIWNLIWILAILIGIFLIMILFSVFQHIIILSPIIAATISIIAESKKEKVDKELTKFNQLLEKLDQKQEASSNKIPIIILPLALIVIIWIINYLVLGDPIISFARTIFFMLLISILFSSILIISGFRKIKKLKALPKLD